MALQSSTETSSSFIPLILHEEIHEKFFNPILHSEDKRALRLILHAEGKEIFYPVYKTLQRHSRHSSSTRTFQSFMTFQTFQSFMTFQPSRHYYMFQHFQYIPAPSSMTLYIPVLSSTIQSIQGFHPFQHFSN